MDDETNLELSPEIETEQPARKDRMFTCPFCQHEFKLHKQKRCPKCNIEFTQVHLIDTSKTNRAGRLKSPTIVADPQHPDVMKAHEAKNKPVEIGGKVGKCVSDPNDIPQVYYLGEEEITNKTGQVRQVKRFRAEFTGILYRGWVYCPGCWRKLFQNQMIDSGAFVQEYQCKDCHAITQFIFTSGRTVFRAK